jgi:Ca2+-binding EF-hand superfamily protein
MKFPFSHTCTLLTSAALVLLSQCATEDTYSRLDANTDGKTTPREFDAYMKQGFFHRIDADSDRLITFSEWKAFNPKVTETTFRNTDLNRDGFISRAESDKRYERDGSLKKLFAVIDIDKNGSLSNEEASNFRSALFVQKDATPVERLIHAAQSYE